MPLLDHAAAWNGFPTACCEIEPGSCQSAAMLQGKLEEPCPSAGSWPAEVGASCLAPWPCEEVPGSRPTFSHSCGHCHVLASASVDGPYPFLAGLSGGGCGCCRPFGVGCAGSDAQIPLHRLEQVVVMEGAVFRHQATACVAAAYIAILTSTLALTKTSALARAVTLQFVWDTRCSWEAHQPRGHSHGHQCLRCPLYHCRPRLLQIASSGRYGGWPPGTAHQTVKVKRCTATSCPYP